MKKKLNYLKVKSNFQILIKNALKNCKFVQNLYLFIVDGHITKKN